MISKRVVVAILTVALLRLDFSYSLIVQTQDGWVRGGLGSTRSSVSYSQFLGIPYAEAPIGDLRFKAPVAKRPWDDERDCTNFGPICMQADSWRLDPASEDCLHLNVYTKNIPSDENTQLKPVIVFIHGGAFETGTSNDHGADYLMERDIVLVTFNYRLGAFGLLAVETKDIPGNAAMKDQVLALKWVQRNIQTFGGDPNKVTLGGLSSGGHCASAHMVSSMSQGLFHNLISMSGSITWQRKLKTNNIDNAKILAGNVNCTTENVESMMQCLMNKPASEIANNMKVTFLSCPTLTWTPTVEEDFGQERFLTDQPNELYRIGNFSKVNVIVGVTADEFLTPVPSFLNNSNQTKILNDNFDEIASTCFRFEDNGVKTTEEISAVLRKSYFPFDTIDIRSFSSLNHLFADGSIGYGVHKFVHFISNLTDVYYYKFSYIGRFSIFNYPNEQIPYGVNHADDLQYLFNSYYAFEQSDPENVVVERMTRMWENLAWTGNPNNATDEYLSEMVWPKHDTVSEYYLDIGTHLVEKNGLFLERYTIWDNLESSGPMLRASYFIILAFIISF